MSRTIHTSQSIPDHQQPIRDLWIDYPDGQQISIVGGIHGQPIIKASDLPALAEAAGGAIGGVVHWNPFGYWSDEGYWITDYGLEY